MAWGHGVAVPKPEPRKRTKARKQREDAKQLKAFRDAVWKREHDRIPLVNVPEYLAACQSCQCWVSRRREAWSPGQVHHRIPRSRCTKEQRYDPNNGVLLCHGCHRLAQEHRIIV